MLDPHKSHWGDLWDVYRVKLNFKIFGAGIPTGGKTGRRGSRPFLSPDAPPTSLVGALQTHRDSLSPDSAAEEAAGSSKLRGRRDSRPHLSPDGDSGSHTLGADGSPRSGSRGLRRQSTTTDDIYK